MFIEDCEPVGGVEPSETHQRLFRRTAPRWVSLSLNPPYRCIGSGTIALYQDRQSSGVRLTVAP